MSGGVAAVDTDVLAIHHIFTWDKRWKTNASALFLLRRKYIFCIPIHGLLELYGLAILAWGVEKARVLFKGYLKAKDVKIMGYAFPSSWEEYVDIVSSYIERRMNYGDALIAWTLEENDVEVFVTWNKKHFKGKVSAKVYTPEELLRIG